MKDTDFNGKAMYNINYSRHVQNTTKRVKKILDANYHKAHLFEVSMNCKHLVTSERAMLLLLLKHQAFHGAVICFLNHLGSYLFSASI